MNIRQSAGRLVALIVLVILCVETADLDPCASSEEKAVSPMELLAGAVARVAAPVEPEEGLWKLCFDQGCDPASGRYVHFERAENETSLRMLLEKNGALPVVEKDGVRRMVTRELRVKFEDAELELGLRKLGLRSGQELDFAPGWMIAEAADPLAALAVVESVGKLPGVSAVDVLLARQQIPRGVPNDPLFSEQWYLARSGSAIAGSDANISNLWGFPDGPGLRGEGVRIGIVDDGIETRHPDLVMNIDAENGKDWNGEDFDPAAEVGNNHGTACAGVAAARGGNGMGICGAAPAATIVGLRLIAGPTTDLQEAQAMAWRNDVIEIKSNSWGPNDTGGSLEEPGPLTRAALESATTNGRGGLGSIIVWAGGNGGEIGDNSNYDGYANSIHTIAVGSSDSLGQPASYSERGANIVVCAPSSGSGSALSVTSTDRVGGNGYVPGDYTSDFEGTSSSTALVSGVIALMLEKNPNLGWRDVQEILIRSAAHLRPNDPEWIANGAGIWFHPRLGAGKIDASAAVAMADGWVNLTEAGSASESHTNLSMRIPESTSAGIWRTFTMPALRCEHVTMKVNISHTSRGNLEVELTSPSGTVSRLSEVHTDLNNNFSNWTFSSVRHWGEDASGVWTLRVADRSSLGNLSGGILNSAELTVHGTPIEWNADPEISAVHLNAHGQAYDDFDLRVSKVEATDADGDPLSFEYKWQSSDDGIVFADVVTESSQILPSNSSNSGKIWRCAVTASDGKGGSATAYSEGVNLLDRPGYLVGAGEMFEYQSGLVLPAPATFRLGTSASLPSGLVLDPLTGLISGTIDTEVNGSFVILIERFTVSEVVVSQGFELSVGDTGGFDVWTEGAADDDANGDGSPNLVAYAMGAATDQSTVLRELRRDEGSMSLSYQESMARSDVRMLIETSTSLPGEWSTDGIAISEQWRSASGLERTLRAEISINPEEEKRFLRLRATRAP